MHINMPRPTPSMTVSACALFVALGGTGYAASTVVTAQDAEHLGGRAPSYYAPAATIVSSHGERFFSAGQSVTLGKDGHLTFFATCTKEADGQPRVAFDVKSSTYADLDGNGPMPAGGTIVIHEDSDALDNKSPEEFIQVESASSSTEVTAAGEEADVFYNDGVNWPAGNGSSAHACFAGYTGFMG